MSRPVQQRTDHVARYYDDKTARLLEKYGPGPRVHFHTGLFEGQLSRHAPAEELRRHMVRSQEALLLEALDAWGRSSFAGHVLDVGCGLGGTLLLLLEETPAERVTGVTVAASHVAVIRDFAAAAGVSSRVAVEVCDAAAVEGEARFDAAISVEASCYFDRRAWLACMRRVLRPGARLFVIDCFLDRPELGPPFDAYWRTRIGALAEYEEAAAASGFTLAGVTSLNERCRRFWDLSLAYTDALLEHARGDERERLLRSRREHDRLLAAFTDGGIRYLRLMLERA